ncbi:MAG: phosphate ABC transporter permease PstA [Lachnospiraceae bacterium]|nr:phosphate ABC transporter permease PstA [Lachnospiraceae bacterium]
MTSVIERVLVIFAAVFSVGILIFILVYILGNGIPSFFTTDETGKTVFNTGLFAWKYTSSNQSMMPAIINTLIMMGLVLVISVPIGMFSAIYLVEYAKRGSKLVKVVRVTTETLSGIPSIVFGLFGYLFMVVPMKQNSLFAGAITMSMMVLPLIMRTTEEALKAVPDSYREGSFGLGAGKLRTVFRTVLPTAIPGILSGVILAIGRVSGETAALIYTAGTITGVPSSIMGSGRTLAVHMYAQLNEGIYMDQAYATAVVLLLMVLLLNGLSGLVGKMAQKKNQQ